MFLLLRLCKFYYYLQNIGECSDFQVLKDADLTGKTCLITGGSSGIGQEITRCLMSKNCNILMAVRNPYAVNNAVNSSNKINDSGTLKVYDLNLASFASVKKCTDKLLKEQKFVFCYLCRCKPL